MQLELFTDGACSGNPGPGGWGCVLKQGRNLRKLSGYEPQTTNNRMELMAAIAGLEALRKPCAVKIVTDSTYVKNAFTEGWLSRWQKSNWRTSAKTEVKNVDLWKRLLALEQVHTVTWEWVKGHSGHVYNEICDLLARTAIMNAAGVDEREELPS